MDTHLTPQKKPRCFVKVKEEQIDIKQESLEGTTNPSLFLPEKSRDVYEKAYNDFISWCNNNKVTQYSESKILAYFSDIADRGMIASLWPKYSMLKATLNLKHKIDISKFDKLETYLKGQTKGYKPKRSKVINKEQMKKFISEAPDCVFLMVKVALIFGVAGAMRRIEMINLEVDDVQDLGSQFLVTIGAPESKTSRIFTVVDDEEKIFLNLIRRYISLRPKNTLHKRFFIFYKDNKCFTKPVGKNAFSKFPSQIAEFLGLEQPHLYTGNCFRHSSDAVTHYC